MKNKLFSVIAIALFGTVLIACSSSNSSQIDKALDKLEEALENDPEEALELYLDFIDKYDYDTDLSEAQRKRYDQIMENSRNGLYDDESESIADDEEEMYFSYKVLLDSKNSFRGLAILYGDDDMIYLKFDDEATIYNDCIYEWFLAYKMAKNLWEYNEYEDKESQFCGGDKKLKEQKINSYLKCAHCMPDCLEKYVTDDLAVEVFRKTYYDIRDIGIYAPERQYGEWKYPYDGNYAYSFFLEEYYNTYIRLKRIDDDSLGVPKGTLSIYIG